MKLVLRHFSGLCIEFFSSVIQNVNQYILHLSFDPSFDHICACVQPIATPPNFDETNHIRSHDKLSFVYFAKMTTPYRQPRVFIRNQTSELISPSLVKNSPTSDAVIGQDSCCALGCLRTAKIPSRFPRAFRSQASSASLTATVQMQEYLDFLDRRLELSKNRVELMSTTGVSPRSCHHLNKLRRF